jgi:hypothetical protein
MNGFGEVGLKQSNETKGKIFVEEKLHAAGGMLTNRRSRSAAKAKHARKSS